MRGIAVLSFFMALALMTCGARAQAPATLTAVTWLAEDIGGDGVIDNLQSTFSIDHGSRISGMAGCNRFNGMVKLEGAAISVGPLAASRKMCPPAIMDQERKFLEALAKAKSFEIEDAFLRLLGDEGVPLMRLVKQD
jgi:heat shock protein HslJ